MTRVVCLLGSPRPGGNSDQLASRFCEVAAKQGAEIVTHALRGLQYSGYVGDGSAGLDGPEDDLTPVLEDVKGADVLVLATPIYFCNMTGQMKLALDRFFGLFRPDYLTNPEPTEFKPGMALVLVQVQGEGPELYGDLLEQYGPALNRMGFARRELIRACNVRAAGDVMEDAGALAQAERLAEELVQGESDGE